MKGAVGVGMLEGEEAGVEREARGPPPGALPPVDRIAEDGMPHLGEVDSHLVRAPGLEPRLDE